MTRSRRSTPDRRRTGSPSADAALPEGEAAAAEDADPEAVARAIVLRRLTRAPQTRAQLTEALVARNVPEPVIDAVLDRMVEVGLVNDAEYAAMFVRSQRATRGLAPRMLAQELRRKGVDEALIRAELEAIDHDDDRALAEALVARRASLMAHLDPEVRSRRLVGMLLRKGFPQGVAFDVVRRALADAELLDEG